MRTRIPKIAIISALIGNGGESGVLAFTDEAQRQVENYGMDVYSFSDKDLDLLKPFFEPTLKIEDVVADGFADRLRMKWYRQRYKQPVYPTEKDDYTRLVAKIPKILFYKLVPDTYDYYIWLDSKFTIQEHWAEYMLWLIDRHQDCDIITSKHNARNSVKEEVEFMLKYRNVEKTMPLKYDMAKIAWQYSAYSKNDWFVDDKLFELTMIVYSKSMLKKKAFCEEWYAHNYYYTIQDQVSFPFLLQKHKLKVWNWNQMVFEMPFTIHEYCRPRF